ncbi:MULTISPECIES: DUF6976 family protein [Cellvibrio]|uniref:Uncharacterized protein n=1 Tax=Cellvibrio fibrivorans TaxID=126350 RepID=A0ABU1UV73_9GAMM|nr:hypothetical protein [Cellvibrio fibrivorans]MDR7089096.1 hypothetical protein [Cellvibrio fibrivorans]
MAQDADISIRSALINRDQLIEKINKGEYLVIAADESVLTDLPSGNWIAGTIPYFMTAEGGKVDREKIFVNTIEGVQPNNAPRITLYDGNSIARIAQEAPEHGFTIIILPAMSEVHLSYAQNAPDYPNMYFSPIIGWISGVHLDDIGSRSAKVGFGPARGMLFDQQAVAMHIPLPTNQLANINIVNLFSQGDGPEIKFKSTGFSVSDCTINGEAANLADYIKYAKVDTRLPLVANYSGVMINVSIQQVNESNNKVDLYAPVFADISYRFAKPVENYIESFNKELSASASEGISFSCNCILNYLYSELEGKKTRDLTGPITFGEVAYQLLNQTLVYLSISGGSR